MKIRRKASADSCWIKNTGKYEKKKKARWLFCNNVFNHTRLRCGDE